MMAAKVVNTKHVAERLKLRFATLEEVLAEAETLVAAERRRAVRALGNWTLGQAIGHLAFWADAPYDGYPEMRRLPWIARKLLLLLKSRILNGSLPTPAGVRIPDVADGTFGTAVIGAEEALDRLQRSFARLATQAPTTANLLFGMMTHEEWVKLNLRHAELHLSFFVVS